MTESATEPLSPPTRRFPWLVDDVDGHRIVGGGLDDVDYPGAPDEREGFALDDPRHPAAPIVLDVDGPAIDSQWDDDQ